MRDYREKRVEGWITDGRHFDRARICVRMTHDDKGKSLSLSVEEGNILFQIGIPLESVEDIIEIAEKGETE